MSDRVLFTLTKKLANGNVASIPLTERQSNLISTLLDFHDGEFAEEDLAEAPYSVETLDEVMMLRNHLAKMP
jgi:hypothetical protein